MAGQWARLATAGVAILVATGAGMPPVIAAEGPAAAADRAASADAHFELGEIYHRQLFEALDNAIKEYEAAIRLRPDFARAHFNLALSYHTKAKLEGDDKDMYRKALEQYRLFLRQNPGGELASKAKQNIEAAEAHVGEERRGAGGAEKRPQNRKEPSKR